MLVNALWWGWRHVFTWITRALDQALEHQSIWILVGAFVRFEGCEEPIDSKHEAIVYYSLVLQCGNLMPSTVAFLVNLGLFGADEGLFVNVGMDLNV